jgi:hypothetical protein
MINNQFSLEMKSGIEPIGGHRLTERARKTVCTVPGVPAGFNPCVFSVVTKGLLPDACQKQKWRKLFFN